MTVLRDFIAGKLLPLEGYHPSDDQRPDHAPAAVLVPLIDRPEGLSVLLTRRTDHLRSHAGQIAFPGGRADPGETPWETALREAHEEVGLDPALVALAGLSDAFWTRTGYVITPVVGFVDPALTASNRRARLEDARLGRARDGSGSGVMGLS